MLTTTRAWVAGAAALAVLVLAASWFLLISPQRAQANDLTAQAAASAQSNDQLAAKVAELRHEYVTLPAKQQELADLQQHIPANLALSTLTRQLNAAAVASNVTLSSIAAGAPAAPVADGTTAASSVVTSTMTLAVTGSFANLQVFLQSLQSLQRDFLITSLGLGTGASSDSSSSSTASDDTDGAPATTTSGELAATVTGTVFVLPNAPTSTASTTTAATAPVTSTSPTS